jgi:ABC-type glycerol-3-phosphate transport system permease component
LCRSRGYETTFEISRHALKGAATIQSQTELGVFLAAMFIACLVPIIGFLIFQRSFLRGSGLSGAIKG